MTARITLILCILALVLASVACDWDWDRDADRSDTGQTAVEAVETAAAIQLHAQLTAIAPFGPAEVEEP